MVGNLIVKCILQVVCDIMLETYHISAWNLVERTHNIHPQSYHTGKIAYAYSIQNNVTLLLPKIYVPSKFLVFVWNHHIQKYYISKNLSNQQEGTN